MIKILVIVQGLACGSIGGFLADNPKYNAMWDAIWTLEFNKGSFWSLCEVNCSYANTRPAVHHNNGWRFDTSTHVLNEKGQIIPGLYAAGREWLHAGNRLGGKNLLTDIFTFLTIAGQTVVEENLRVGF